MGKKIPLPVWIIPIPVLKTNVEVLVESEKHFVKEVFPVISCLNNSISCVEKQCLTHWSKGKTLDKG